MALGSVPDGSGGTVTSSSCHGAGTPRSRGVLMCTLGERAVVLGAGIAGLLAARVVSDFYETVTLVERDALPDGCAQRRGVPQGRHLHALLSSGSQALERLFP